MKQQHSRYDCLGHAFGSGPPSILCIEKKSKTIFHGTGTYSGPKQDASGRTAESNGLSLGGLYQFPRRSRSSGASVDSVSARQVSPRLYFSALVQLAKVLEVQHEKVEAFDAQPRPREEALRKLEERAGPDARKLFEAFLR
jgi:hypothetical protein